MKTTISTLKTAFLGWFAIALYSCEGFGQTNCAAPRTLFSVPHMELKKLEGEPGAPLQVQRTETPERAPARDAVVAPPLSVTISTNTSSPAAGEFALSSTRDDDFFQKQDIYRRLDEGGYLNRVEPQSLIERSIDYTFRPELLHVGKTTMSCTLMTAIKRKNPFCLLNPIFLQWSW